ncbi:MAG: Gfo/Idh/MocA family protein [Planctomycetaceae bacterium]
MSQARIAVIGYGHLGKIHARLLNGLEDAKLAAVVDPIPAACVAAEKELGIPVATDYREVLRDIDGAIIAAPTSLHFEVASELLEAGKHVFVEKPITLETSDAEELVDLARMRGLALQVGHVERFNPALQAFLPHAVSPRYIESRRLTAYTCRSIDVGVVLDLMIHDLDIVLTLAKADLLTIEASGGAVFGPHEDWAEARLTFADGCVAQLHASRVSHISERTLHFRGERTAGTVDFAAKKATTVTQSAAVQRGEVRVASLSAEGRQHVKDRLFQEFLPQMELPIADCNAILQEQREFVRAVQLGLPVTVTGEAGLAALRVAEGVLMAMRCGQRIEWSRKEALSGGTVQFARPLDRHRKAG